MLDSIRIDVVLANVTESQIVILPVVSLALYFFELGDGVFEGCDDEFGLADELLDHFAHLVGVLLVDGIDALKLVYLLR